MTNIQDIFEEKKVNIKIENGNIFLILKIPMIGKGEDLISIELNKKSLSLEELNENLTKEVSQLRNRIEYLEEENKKNKNKIELLEKNEIELKNKIIINSLIDSKIITSKEELDLIINRLKQIDYFRNKNISIELILRGTRDGRTSKIFFIKNEMEYQKQLQ